MSDDTKPIDNTRKPGGGMWFSHRQLGVGSLVGALFLIAPLKKFFWAREEGEALVKEVAAIHVEQQEHYVEILRRQERLTDKVIERIKDAREQATRDSDRQDRRIETLEAQQMGRPRKSKDN